MQKNYKTDFENTQNDLKKRGKFSWLYKQVPHLQYITTGVDPAMQGLPVSWNQGLSFSCFLNQDLCTFPGSLSNYAEKTASQPHLICELFLCGYLETSMPLTNN